MPDTDRFSLERVLAEPALALTVQGLAPELLLRAVRRVGLEDAGELLSLATTEQLLDLLDADAWSSAEPGADEELDAARFSLWLQVLCEAGSAVVAARLAELPFDFVAHALCSQMLVLETDSLGQMLAATDADEAERIEKALDGCLCAEQGGYLLVSRGHDGWDELVDVITALDQNHGDLLERLLERGLAASSELADDSGGYAELLSLAEMLAGDAAAGRGDRRARAGYVSPADARAFLALCVLDAPLERDPITAAYFREREVRPAAAPPRQPGDAVPSWVAALAADAEGEPATPTLALGGEVASALVAALRQLAAEDPLVADRRLEELTYLANVVTAGARRGARRYRPAESATAVVDACTAGLERLLARPDESRSALEIVRGCGADLLFRLGWPATGGSGPSRSP